MFGTRLKQLREEYNITQQQLADLLNVGRSTIAGYETKGKEPDFDKIVSVANYFNVTVDFLLGKTNERLYPFYSTKKTSPESEDPELVELLQKHSNKSFIRDFDLLSREQQDMIIAQMEVLLKNYPLKP